MARKLTIGVLGLGKMGMQIARRLQTKGFKVVGWNRSEGPREAFKKTGGEVAAESGELVKKLASPRILWFMLPAGDLLDEMLLDQTGLASSLAKGDIVIDGGNSFYEDTIRRGKQLAKLGIHFFDCGTSGGIWGEKNGFSLMVGGPAPVWPVVKPIFAALAAGNGKNYGLVGKNGAGHFVKMVHNGIEYGMMEAIGEGLAVLNASEFELNLPQIAQIWSKGAVISSWLMELAKNALEEEKLEQVVGYIHHTGEGEWTIKTAKKLGIDIRVIEDAFKIRQESTDPKNQQKFSNKLVALLRKQFGGHEVKYKK